MRHKTQYGETVILFKTQIIFVKVHTLKNMFTHGRIKKKRHYVPIGESCFLDTKDKLMKGDMTFFRVLYNNTHKYANLGLHPVYGSLAVGTVNFGSHDNLNDEVKPVWDAKNNKLIYPGLQFLNGGRGSVKWTTLQEFANFKTGTARRNEKGELIFTEVDMHVWLEDDKGNVYDVIDTDFFDWAEEFGEMISGEEEEEIAGLSKRMIRKRHGLHYIPAEGLTQPVIQKAIEKWFLPEYEPFLKKHGLT